MTIRLAPELREELRRLGVLHSRSTNGEVVEALKQWLKRYSEVLAAK